MLDNSTIKSINYENIHSASRQLQKHLIKKAWYILVTLGFILSFSQLMPAFFMKQLNSGEFYVLYTTAVLSFFMLFIFVYQAVDIIIKKKAFTSKQVLFSSFKRFPGYIAICIISLLIFLLPLICGIALDSFFQLPSFISVLMWIGIITYSTIIFFNRILAIMVSSILFAAFNFPLRESISVGLRIAKGNRKLIFKTSVLTLVMVYVATWVLGFILMIPILIAMFFFGFAPLTPNSMVVVVSSIVCCSILFPYGLSYFALTAMVLVKRLAEEKEISLDLFQFNTSA